MSLCCEAGRRVQASSQRTSNGCWVSERKTIFRKAMVCARRIYINNAFIIRSRDNDRHGNPDAETVARLEAAIAQVDQASCIVLTGQEYHNQSMRRWLSQNMTAKLPVYSVIGHDTIGQAVFSAPVTHALGITNLTVITSDYHIPRSRAIFE